MAGDSVERLMKEILHHLKGMVDVNTVVGEAVETHGGVVIIPFSRVTFGFAAGGGDVAALLAGREEEKNGKRNTIGQSSDPPFAGGSGAGMNIQPLGFLVVVDREVRMLTLTETGGVTRLLELAPQLIDRIRDIFLPGEVHESVDEHAHPEGFPDGKPARRRQFQH